MNVLDQAEGDGWVLYNGDSAEVMQGLPSDSIDLITSSPPFASLYTYSPSERDLGNARGDVEFNTHFGFIVREMLRVLKPGRVAAIHVTDIPAMLIRDGYIGMKDFSGDVIRLFISNGWTFDARVPIDKNQQAQSIRTHSKGLTMTQMGKDRSWSRPAMPDYILKFRKSGDNAVPVRGGVTGDDWIEMANPIWPGEDDRAAEYGSFSGWYGIRENDTLNIAEGREEADERHICALQLPTIERCVRLWTNPGEVVLDPFSGIGSVPYQAVKIGRKGIGIELKSSYFKAGVRNMGRIEAKAKMPDMLDLIEATR